VEIGGYKHLPHHRVLAKHRLDFTQLNAKAANLNLVVAAAKVFDFTVGQKPSEVARAIQPRPRFIGEGIRQKSRAREFRPVEIAARDARPADVEFTNAARGTGR
jgi:hypothetical protein